MKNLKIFLLALAMFFSLLSFGQEKIITGTVSDNSGFLPGVSVIVEGTHRGTQTDIDGKYNIRVAINETLLFNFVGMKKESILVSDSDTLNITMNEDSSIVSEVIPLPYNPQMQKKVIEAIVTISKKDIEKSKSSKVSLGSSVEKIVENDVKNNSLKIYLLGGIVSFITKDDLDFGKKYNIIFHDFGCVVPLNITNYENYNEEVFNYLKNNFGTKWQEEIRKDTLGFKKWKAKNK